MVQLRYVCICLLDKGSEDIQVLPNGLAFFSSGFQTPSRGDIMLFNFKKPRHGAHALDIVGDLDRSTFSPLGLSIWRDCNSNVIYIFVVNARLEGKNTVEKFRYDEKRRKLYHLRTYCDPTITQYVYISEKGGKRLSVYIRESDNSLTLTQVVQLEAAVGNINVDVVSGHLWVAVFQDIQSLLKHMQPPHTALSPSQVLRLTVSEDSKVTDIAEVYCNDGRHINAASIAVHYGRFMLVGSIFTKLFLCEVIHA
ncbi:hypothetical protein LSAT2_011054 [Lamellibrachia satsuma]|nr:hypothetical protein LSAT2_011054 [Lamellibrachia satsuma]